MCYFLTTIIFSTGHIVVLTMQLKDVRYVLIEKILRLLSLTLFFWVIVPNGIGDVDLAGDLGLIVKSSN